MRSSQGFYEEVASPLLSEVDLRYPDNAVDFLTTNHFDQLFNGSEIVVAGHLTDNNLDNFLVEVLGQGVRINRRQQSDVFLVPQRFINRISTLYSLRMTSKCRVRPVLWTGTSCTQRRNTFLGISQSVCGPTLLSSSCWNRGQFQCLHSGET